MVPSRDLDHASMLSRVGVGENRLGLDGFEQLLEIGVEQIRLELELTGIAFSKLLVGFSDTDDLDVRSLCRGGQKASDVPVHQTGDSNAKRFGG